MGAIHLAEVKEALPVARSDLTWQTARTKVNLMLPQDLEGKVAGSVDLSFVSD